MEGRNLLKLVQEKLAEKEEIIHEQQRQLEELNERLAKAEQAAAESTGSADLEAALEEKEEVLREQMKQIVELTDQLEAAGTAGDKAVEEKEEVIREQMTQILELQERVEQLEANLVEARSKAEDFDKMEQQLKELLGEA